MDTCGTESILPVDQNINLRNGHHLSFENASTTPTSFSMPPLVYAEGARGKLAIQRHSSRGIRGGKALQKHSPPGIASNPHDTVQIGVSSSTIYRRSIEDPSTCVLFDHNSGWCIGVCTKAKAESSGSQSIIDVRKIVAWDQMPCGGHEIISTAENFLKCAVNIAIFTLLGQPGQELIVHCKNGRSRSPTAVFTYFLIFRGWAIESLLDWFQVAFRTQRRETAKTSPDFPNINRFLISMEYLVRERGTAWMEAALKKAVNEFECQELIHPSIEFDKILVLLSQKTCSNDNAMRIPDEGKVQLDLTSYYYLVAGKRSEASLVNEETTVKIPVVTRPNTRGRKSGRKSGQDLTELTSHLYKDRLKVVVKTEDEKAIYYFTEKLGFIEPLSGKAVHDRNTSVCRSLEFVPGRKYSLIWAAGYSLELCQWLDQKGLISREALVARYNFNKMTLTYRYTRAGSLTLVKWIYSKVGDASFGTVNNDGKCPLYKAIDWGFIQIIKFYILNADIDKDYIGRFSGDSWSTFAGAIRHLSLIDASVLAYWAKAALATNPMSRKRKMLEWFLKELKEYADHEEDDFVSEKYDEMWKKMTEIEEREREEEDDELMKLFLPPLGCTWRFANV